MKLLAFTRIVSVEDGNDLWFGYLWKFLWRGVINLYVFIDGVFLQMYVYHLCNFFYCSIRFNNKNSDLIKVKTVLEILCFFLKTVGWGGRFELLLLIFFSFFFLFLSGFLVQLICSDITDCDSLLLCITYFSVQLLQNIW